VLGVIPLAHPVGITLVMNAFFLSGSRMILMPKFDPQAALKTMAEYRSTHLIGVPTMFRSLTQAAPSTLDTSSLKTCLSVGEGMDQETLDKFGSVFRIPLLEGYGLTEASPMVSFNNPVPDRKARCLGLPLPGIDMKIVDENGNQVKPGEVGEVIVKGPVVMKGYWRRPEETARVLKQGWLWTGDLAVFHDDGFAFWKGRRSDIILKSGFEIYPREVEAVISDHPKIREVAVTGIPDPVVGEEIHAYAVLKEGETATSEEIVEHCKGRLAPYKCPRTVHFIASLPKSTTGRVIRHKLRSAPKI
jgi:long-chain acyl-CoA synthetase